MSERRKSLRFIAVFLALATAQAYTQLSFAATSLTSAGFPAPQSLARLTTKGNLPISVNGASASSGDTIGNEAIVETPGNVDASVDLGPLGSLDIEPGTRIKLEYDANCASAGSGGASGPQGPGLQQCSVKVTVYAGCVTAHHKQGAYFRAVTQQEMLIRDSDRKDAGTFKICAGGAPAGAAAAGPGGLSTVTKIAIAALLIGGGSTVAWFAFNDDDPSPPDPDPQ